ncbi:hypothetical protein [Pseudomonas sp.]|uniref:hypothetical protein n=1 Tax=Pseudomonas sp. TaxID=306 RepID=UPI003FD78B6B
MNREVSLHVMLENSCHSMSDAGSFLFAVGKLLSGIIDHDLLNEIGGEVVLDGLGAGLRIAGAVLSDEATEVRRRIDSATQNADNENVSRTVEVPA